MEKATELFENSISWLRENYNNFKFFTEHDIVWTIQTHIIQLIEDHNLPYQAFTEFPILPGKRRSICTDLAIIDLKGSVEVAIEFKYEPSHKRIDILRTKFPVVFWGDEGVGKDVKRVQEYITKGVAKVAYSVFIDEGSYFSYRDPHPGSEWIDWGTRQIPSSRVSLLWSKVRE